MPQSVEPSVSDEIIAKLREYHLSYKLEQESLNNDIDNALNKYSSKGGGQGGNRPDVKLFVYDKYEKGYPVIIEFKGQKDKLVKYDENGHIQNRNEKNQPYIANIKNYAVNGAVHYADAILHYTTYHEIFAIGVTGYKDALGKLHLEYGVFYVSDSNYGVGEKVDDYTDLSFLMKENFDSFLGKVKNLRLTQEERENIQKRRESEITASLTKLNNDIYKNEKGLGESQRVYLVAAAIMATLGIEGKVLPLEIDDLKSSNQKGDRDGDIVMRKISAFLEYKKLPIEKKNLIIKTLDKTITDDNINKVENGETQLKRVFRKIYDDLGFYYKLGLTTDFTGKLFNEMYSWLGWSQDKMNDVVLTPSYIGTLLVKLARVDKDSYVWDYACGSGGLLVAAMNEMINDAQSKIKSPKDLNDKINHIRDRQLLGIEILPEIYILAVLNMILMGDGSSNMINTDSLTDYNGNYGFGNTNENFPATAFVLNPPYSADGRGMVFVEKALSMMKSGYAAIIIQSSAGSGKATEYNKRILEHNTLLASIKMPKDLFVGKSTVQTNIYVFRVGESHEKDFVVKFIDFTNDGYTRTNRKRASINLRDTDHAKEKYQEVVDLVKYGREKLHFLTEEEYYEGHIDPKNGNDWNQMAPINIQPNMMDIKRCVDDYLSMEILNLLSSTLLLKPEEIAAMQDFENVEWKNFAISSLFDIQSSKHIFHANNIDQIYESKVARSHPYVVRMSKNNGIKGYIIEDENFLNPGLTLSFAQDTFSAFYQKIPYFTGNKVKILVPKFKYVTDNTMLFITSSLNVALQRYTWGTGSTVSTISDLEVSLPVRNDNIDFDFIESVISIAKKSDAYDLVDFINKFNSNGFSQNNG